MKEKKKKKYQKPELKKLKVIDEKVSIKGKLYSLEEILDEEEFNQYHISQTDSHKKENPTHI
ncbi:MAG: hypothetical protein KAT17_03015 [Candidatus Aminicenantes bacterium]|nr:hypothetical protein [Candidatus Aminicenantes bacterium]